jgi:threonyl-tRNA synthetase
MQRKSKANSDKFTALSSQFDTDAQVNKLQSIRKLQHSKRHVLYQSITKCYVNRALQSGIGETIKEGTPIATLCHQSMILL